MLSHQIFSLETWESMLVAWEKSWSPGSPSHRGGDRR